MSIGIPSPDALFQSLVLTTNHMPVSKDATPDVALAKVIIEETRMKIGLQFSDGKWYFNGEEIQYLYPCFKISDEHMEKVN